MRPAHSDASTRSGITASHPTRRFLRTFKGSVAPTTKTNLGVDSRYDVDDNSVTLNIINLGSVASRVTVANAYGNDDPITRSLAPGQSVRQQWQLKDSFGWYDLSVVTDSDPSFFRRLAGHPENGRDSVSDPAIGAAMASRRTASGAAPG